MPKKTRRTKKKKRSSRNRFDRTEISQLCFYSLLYFLFIIVIGGLIKTKLNEIYYVAGIALDLQEGFWTLAGTCWILIVMWSGLKAYKN
jgi:hypothetical protein